MPKPKHRQTTFQTWHGCGNLPSLGPGRNPVQLRKKSMLLRDGCQLRGGILSLEPPALSPAWAGQGEKLAGGHVASSPPSRLPSLSIKGNQQFKLYWKK